MNINATLNLNLKNRTKVALYALISLFALFLLYIVFAPDSYKLDILSDLKFFPFKAEVWGNLSDWALVGVVSIASVLIWRTLQSQQEVQKMQYAMSFIEVDKHRLQIMPVFNASAVSDVLMDEKQRLGQARVSVTYNVTNDIARDLRYTIYDLIPGATDEQEKLFTQNIWLSERVEEVEPERDYNIVLDFDYPAGSLGKHIQAQFQYKDRLGNEYQQAATIHISNHGSEQFLGLEESGGLKSQFNFHSKPNLVKLVIEN